MSHAAAATPHGIDRPACRSAAAVAPCPRPQWTVPVRLKSPGEYARRTDMQWPLLQVPPLHQDHEQAPRERPHQIPHLLSRLVLSVAVAVPEVAPSPEYPAVLAGPPPDLPLCRWYRRLLFLPCHIPELLPRVA